MKRISSLVTDEQHKWLKEQKDTKRQDIEFNVRAGLDLLIKKDGRKK